MKWKCNICGATKDVINGECPDDGATQTTPIDDEAKESAGLVISEPKEVDHEDE